jgi:hypothetical protein
VFAQHAQGPGTNPHTTKGKEGEEGRKTYSPIKKWAEGLNRHLIKDKHGKKKMLNIFQQRIAN